MFVLPGFGDYPKIPLVGVEARSPYGDYDYEHLRANYGEVHHHELDGVVGDRYNPQAHTLPYYSM